MHKVFESSDSNVKKFVFEFKGYKSNEEDIEDRCDAIAEAVLYKYNSYEERTVICCSIQSGCPVGCSFCGTGKFFVRNLTTTEIIDQVNICILSTKVKADKIKKLQIMFMSMGEPFLNFNALEVAIRRLYELYSNADLLVSTSAPYSMYLLMPQFIQLCKEIPKVGLQFSVHESTDENRAKLIPLRTSTLRQISLLGEMWAAYVGRKPFFNYCVHENNGKYEDAENLSKYFNPNIWECTLSVICNSDENVKSSIERQLDLINKFKGYLLNKGYSIRVFNPAGQDDIGGGCGQLWYFQEWLNQKENKENE